MYSVILIFFILVLAVLIHVAMSKRGADTPFAVIGMGALISLIAGIDAMSKDRDVSGAILIATGLICLLGIAIAVRAFQPRP
ncbi:MAG TPA: hypothetical protein VGL77_11595 [Armatimonadota bacterium]